MESKLSIALFIVFANFYLTTAELCGPKNLSCIKGQALCVNNACKCKLPKYVWGDGYFACYKKNQVAAELRNDPTLTNFNNQTHQFPFPCRYLMTHVKQELKDGDKNVIGECEFKVHAFNKRARGKVYVYGVDIAAKIMYQNGTVVSRSVRKFGNQASGKLDMTVQGVQHYHPDGPWTPNESVDYNDDGNDIEIKSYVDANNRNVFEFKRCGLWVTLLPYDIEDRRNQPYIPGLSVAINCAHHPVWLSNDQVMGLAPYWQGGQVVSEIVYPMLTIQQSLVHRAFTRDVEQNQPFKSESCVDIKNVLDSCREEKSHIAEKCWWMLTEPRFIRCASNNGLDFVELYKRCAKAFCNDRIYLCNGIQRDLQVCKNVDGIEKLDEVKRGAWCPRPSVSVING